MDEHNNLPPDDDDSPVKMTVETHDYVKPMGLFERMLGPFFYPVRLMENIREYPKFLSPAVFFIIMGVITGLLSLKYTEIALLSQQSMILERYGKDYYDLMMAGMNMTAQMGSGATSVITYISAAFSTVTTYLSIGFIMALVYLPIVKLCKGQTTYTKLSSMFLHIAQVDALGASLNMMLGTIFFTPINLLSLAIFSPTGSILSPTFNLLSSINLTTIWSAALIWLGLRKVAGISSGKALVIVLVGLALTIAVAGLVIPQISVAVMDWSYNLLQSTPSGGMR